MRILLASAASVAIILAAPALRSAQAQCTGDCSADIVANGKAVEKYVKKSWAALGKCMKTGTPACPTLCPVPDGGAEPFSLGASCVELLTCRLGEVAAAAYGGAWDAPGACALAPADACGVARAKGARKVVVAKLKRRRTSKMDKFPKDIAKCVSKVDKKAACDGQTLCDEVTDWIDEIVPVVLRKGGYQTLPFEATQAGEGKATLTLSADEGDWALGHSVVVAYDVDAAPVGTIVVYDGANATDYRVLLGDLAAGPHVIGLRHAKKLSPTPNSTVTIHATADVEVLGAGDPGYDPLRFAPVLLGIDRELNPVFGHPGNTVSDVPLVTYVKATPGVGKTTYRYVMIWSNEDGGTGAFPDVLLAQYGRTTDIEQYVQVDVSDTGQLLEVRYRPDESGTLPVFAGSFFGTHPIVRTSTSNGLVEDDGASTLQFALAPFEFDDSGVPRERGMDLDPVSYRVMAKELSHESKLEPVGNPATERLSDMRNYLFLEYDIDVNVSGNVLRGVAVVGGVPYQSDHFMPAPGILSNLVSDGTGRTAIELPPGTSIGDIQSFGMRGFGTMSGTLYALDAFMLDPVTQLPGPHISFSGALAAGGASPSWVVAP